MEPGELTLASPSSPDGSGLPSTRRDPSPTVLLRFPVCRLFRAACPHLADSIGRWQSNSSGQQNKPFGRVLNDRFYANLAFSPDGKRLVSLPMMACDRRTQARKTTTCESSAKIRAKSTKGYGNAQIGSPTSGNARRSGSQQHRTTHPTMSSGMAIRNGLPDGQSIVVHANRTDDQESVTYSINKNYDLWQIDVATRERKQLTPARARGPPRFSRRWQACGLPQQSAQDRMPTSSTCWTSISRPPRPSSRVIYAPRTTRATTVAGFRPLIPIACANSWNDSRTLRINWLMV